MMTVLTEAALNTIPDLISTYGLDMGCKGAAFATICSQVVSAVWIFAFFFGERTILHFRRQYLRLDLKELVLIILLSLSPFFAQVTDCIVPLVMNTGMQQYGNDYYVGTMTVMFSIEQLLRLLANGLCRGAAPIMNYNYGAGKPERAERTFFFVLAFSFGFITIANWLILSFPRTFIMSLTDSQRLIEITIPVIRIYFGDMMFIGVLYTRQRTFMAPGHIKLPLLGAMMRKLVILPLLCFTSPRPGHGTDGLLYAGRIADALGSAIVFAIFIWNFKSMLKTP